MEHDILTIKGILDHSVKNFGERDAFSFIDEKVITYEETDRTVKSLQLFLEKLNIKKGDRVAIYSQNMPNWSICYFAIASMGAVVVPILPDFSLEELGNILDHSEASTLFLSDSLASKVIELNLKILRSELLQIICFC